MSTDVIVFLAGDESWCPPSVPTGSSPLVIPVRDGVVDLMPLHIARQQILAQAQGTTKHWLMECWNVDVGCEEMSLSDLMPILFQDEETEIMEAIPMACWNQPRHEQCVFFVAQQTQHFRARLCRGGYRVASPSTNAGRLARSETSILS